jgi:hypothetical protein
LAALLGGERQFRCDQQWVEPAISSLPIRATCLRRISTDMPLDTAFTFKDESTGVGDYYYVRVEQRDGAIAWSSPVWIGGKGRE